MNKTNRKEIKYYHQERECYATFLLPRALSLEKKEREVRTTQAARMHGIRAREMYVAVLLMLSRCIESFKY